MALVRQREAVAAKEGWRSRTRACRTSAEKRAHRRVLPVMVRDGVRGTEEA